MGRLFSGLGLLSGFLSLLLSLLSLLGLLGSLLLSLLSLLLSLLCLLLSLLSGLLSFGILRLLGGRLLSLLSLLLSLLSLLLSLLGLLLSLLGLLLSLLGLLLGLLGLLLSLFSGLGELLGGFLRLLGEIFSCFPNFIEVGLALSGFCSLQTCLLERFLCLLTLRVLLGGLVSIVTFGNLLRVLSQVSQLLCQFGVLQLLSRLSNFLLSRLLDIFSYIAQGFAGFLIALSSFVPRSASDVLAGFEYVFPHFLLLFLSLRQSVSVRGCFTT